MGRQKKKKRKRKKKKKKNENKKKKEKEEEKRDEEEEKEEEGGKKKDAKEDNEEEKTKKEEEEEEKQEGEKEEEEDEKEEEEEEADAEEELAHGNLNYSWHQLSRNEEKWYREQGARARQAIGACRRVRAARALRAEHLRSLSPAVQSGRQPGIRTFFLPQVRVKQIIQQIITKHECGKNM